MRRALSVIRSEPHLAPQPGVNALPALIDQVRGAGTPVSLVIDGEPLGLPAAVDLTAYRIVQEALTNTRRHAGAGAQATVRLAYQPDLLEIEVADDGHGTSKPNGGNGLRGIVERVTALGGRVDAGPQSAGGFGIRAVLPTGAAL
jgi:signal transduction histidine kinase